MADDFYHEDVQQVPAGYRVRTLTTPTGHEVRLAFPPGRRKRGSGRLVSILHPHVKNTCEEIKRSALSNPHEFVKDSKGKGWLTGVISSGSDYMAEAYPVTGKKVKRAGAPVTARGASEAAAYDALLRKIEPNPKPRVKNFLGFLFGGEKKLKVGQRVEYRLRKQGIEIGRVFIKITKLAKGYVEGIVDSKPFAVVTGFSTGDLVRINRRDIVKNPKAAGSRSTPKKNLDQITQAQKLYEEFSGKPSGKVTMISEPVKVRDDYAHLGWIEWVAFHLVYQDEGYDPRELSKAYHAMMEDGADVDDSWKEIADEFEIKLRVFDFGGDEIRLAASPQGNQLYFLGGKQEEFGEHLKSFQTDTSRDRVLLGEVAAISYEAKKEHLGDKKPTSYYHVFAEESGDPPVAYWDSLTKRIMLVGGNYSLDNAKVGIVN